MAANIPAAKLAPSANTPSVPRQTKIASVANGLIVRSRRKNIPLTDMNMPRWAIGAKSAKSVKRLGMLIPWATPKMTLRLGLR